MKTTSPEFQESFVKECLDHGLGERATAVLLQHAVLTELLEKDASFREGFLKAADGVPADQPVTAGNVVNPSWIESGLGAAGGVLGGVLGGSALGRVAGKLLPGVAKPIGRMLGTKGKLLAGAIPALGGGYLGAKTMVNNGNAGRAEALNGPTSNVNIPSWMLGQKKPAVNPSEDPMKYRFGWRPADSAAAAGGRAAGPNPQVPQALISEKAKIDAIDKQIKEHQAKLLQAGQTPGLGGSVDNYDTRNTIAQLTAQRKQLGSGYDLLRNKYEGERQRVMAELGARYDAGGQALKDRALDAHDYAGWLNKSDPSTIRGWITNAWGKFNNVPNRARDLNASTKSIQEQQVDFKRFWDQLNGLQIQ